MTSQGAGEPFGQGEVIMGYQACTLRGSVYIGAKEKDEEALTNIAHGDEAVFRYVENPGPYKEIQIDTKGSGIVEVFLDGNSAGKIRIKDGVQKNININGKPGKHELTFKFIQPKKLEVRKIVLR